MLVGDPSVFAIESDITQVFESDGKRALGYFLLYVHGKQFGVKKKDATLLACSFDAVEKRLQKRYEHVASFAGTATAEAIVSAFREALYDLRQDIQLPLGFPSDELQELILERDLVWAPDGDEAFDDGGHVLQFDLGETVRIIAFKNLETWYATSETIVESQLNAQIFYDTLMQWATAFERDRQRRLCSSGG